MTARSRSGQSRVLLVWTRIIMPNGTSIVLEHQPGADSAGYAGLEDDVDYHWGNLAKAAGLSTLLGIASELVLNSNNSIVEALRTGTENTVNQTGQTLVSRQLNVQPTLTIRPGFPVRVVVNRDLVFFPTRDDGRKLIRLKLFGRRNPALGSQVRVAG